MEGENEGKKQRKSMVIKKQETELSPAITVIRIPIDAFSLFKRQTQIEFFFLNHVQ